MILTQRERLAVMLQHGEASESGWLSITCQGCGRRAEKHVPNLNAVSDDEAGRMFRTMGWKERRHRRSGEWVCPDCQMGRTR